MQSHPLHYEQEMTARMLDNGIRAASGQRRALRGSAPLSVSVMQDRGRGSFRKLAALITSILVAVAAAILVVSLGYMTYLNNAIRYHDPTGAQRVGAALAGSSVQSRNILVAAVSEVGKDRPYPTSTMVLIHLDSQQKEVWQLWIPPDLISTLPGHGSSPIKDAHLYGGAAGTVQAVKRLTGLPINQYVEVDITAIRRATDFVGGAWVDVPSAITSAQSSAGPLPPDTRVLAGWQQLDGDRALTVVRAVPAFTDPDYAPMRSQQLVTDALASRVGEGWAGIAGFVGTIAPYLKTTMSLAETLSVGKELQDAGSSGSYSAAVIGQTQSRLISRDPKVLSRLVADIRAERPFDVPQAALAQAAASAAAVVSTKPASQVTVTVNNGAGLSGAAKQAAGLLQTHGFVIVATGNANQNVYKQTYVVYKNDASLANLVAQFLQPGVKIVPSNGLYAFKSDILVVIGKDWDIAKAPLTPIVTQ